MGGLADFRTKYPQYNDLSDQQLADSLYKKHYSDMPRDVFDEKMGLAPTPSERFAEANPGTAAPGRLERATTAAADTEGERQTARRWMEPSEYEKSLGTGIARLPARAIGAYKDVAETVGAAGGGIAGWLGASDETKKGIHDAVTGAADAVPGLGSLPNSQQVLDAAGDVNKRVSDATGVDLSLHQPKGASGAAGEFTAGFLGGPRLPAPAVERTAAAAVPKPAVPPPAAAASASPAVSIPDAMLPQVRQRFSAIANDPAQLATYAPEEQAFIKTLASGSATEKGLRALSNNSRVLQIIGSVVGGHLGGPVGAGVGWGVTKGGQAAAGGLANRAVERSIATHTTDKNVGILHRILGIGEDTAGAAPVAAAPRAPPVRTPSPAAAIKAERASLERPPAAAGRTPDPAAERAALQRMRGTAPDDYAGALDDAAAKAPPEAELPPPPPPAEIRNWATERQKSWNTPERVVDREVRAEVDKVAAARTKQARPSNWAKEAKVAKSEKRRQDYFKKRKAKSDATAN